MGEMRGFTSRATSKCGRQRRESSTTFALHFLLLGKTKLEKELHGLSLAPDIAPLIAGDVVLRGVPQAMADQVSEILLEVTPEHRIRPDCDRSSGWLGDRVSVHRSEGER